MPHSTNSSARKQGRITRQLALAGLACALALPLAGAVAEEATSDAATSSPASAITAEAAFETHFEGFETLPPMPAAQGDVVDITELAPPVEIEQQPATRSLGSGVASFYGKRFHGRRTANGERFDMNAMTAAHKTLPFGTRVRVTNTRNGKSTVVRINDRGPFIRGRTIDLSRAAASEIGMISRGHARVELEIIE